MEKIKNENQLTLYFLRDLVKRYQFVRVLLLILGVLLFFTSCSDSGTDSFTTPIPQFIGLQNFLVTKLVYEKPYLYAGTAANGLWRCNLENLGDWEYLGLADTSLGEYTNVGITDLDIKGDDILASYNSGVASLDSQNAVGIWRSTDSGKNWFRSDSGIPKTIDFTLEGNIISACRRSPDKPEIAIAVIAIATYRSTDSGYNWILFSGRRGTVGGNDHERWNPYQPGEIWFWGASSVFQPYLGAAKDYGLNGKVGVDLNKPGFPSDGYVSDVAFDCGDPNIVYAATSKGLMKSSDGGYTWNVGKAKIPDDGYVAFLKEHPLKIGVLFLSGNTSVYYSLDQGETIQILSQIPQVVESMAIDEERERIFIGTKRGVYIVSFESVVK